MDYYKEIFYEQDLVAKIREQRDEIEQQQKELEESLRYAGSIQSALLPEERYFKNIFPDSLILFIPRDIVSGDFYWIYRKKQKVVVVAADCTGHGVPGAFMSMLGVSFLNEIVSKEIPRANIILNRLRENVMKALHQTGEITEHKDGMDIALCMVDLEQMELQFSGAFNPMYLVRKGTLIEVRGDKMPIGIAPIEEKSFTNHILDIRKNDVIYIFSDGFADQFGGPEDRKFRYKPFKELLVKIHKQNMAKQKTILAKKFHRWKGDLEQIDDILIIGFKI
jgi:serine phosphatase RsbU (regulator of sigma subunit)